MTTISQRTGHLRKGTVCKIKYKLLQVKCFFADLTGDVIRAGSFASVCELVRDIKACPTSGKAEGAEILAKIALAALDKAEAA